tara:strand:- start:294 stop:965 length:672 start_codon:yes stop_codon:yes gene_type:complete
LRIFFFIVLFSVLFSKSSDKVAIVIKTDGEVLATFSGLNTKQALKTGSSLGNQDRVETGKNGFAAIMYLDDRTIIKILDDSDLTIFGDRNGNKINKALDIKYGKIAAGIAPQGGKEFRIATPTSVASVKGTELAISSSTADGDSFILIEGLIEVTNSITGETTEVKEGETVISTPEGALEVTETIEEDLEGFELAEVERSNQELRFELEDDEGNIKEVIIKFE